MNEPISIIIIADGYASALERNLPLVLSQQYEPGFEVVVVKESKKSETGDVLKPLMASHENLSSTYLPDKPQYITDGEVAIMLGTKAVKYDHIIIIHPTFEVPSNEWLKDVSDVLNSKLTVGKPHYHSKNGILSRFKHKRKTAKLLSYWCKENSQKKKDIYLNKHLRSLFNIAYSRESYFEDPELRYFIYQYTNP